MERAARADEIAAMKTIKRNTAEGAHVGGPSVRYSGIKTRINENHSAR